MVSIQVHAVGMLWTNMSCRYIRRSFSFPWCGIRQAWSTALPHAAQSHLSLPTDEGGAWPFADAVGLYCLSVVLAAEAALVGPGGMPPRPARQ